MNNLIKVKINELVEEEIRFDTKIKQNDCKIVVEIFQKQIRIITLDIKETI